MANAYQLISIEQVDGLAAALEAAGNTPAEILASLLTVDGPGSGLNADLFDGYNSTDFVFTSSYTAADVLSKLLTVDGASSTLDADLLDGQHGSYYNAWGNLTGAPEYAQAATSASLSLRDTGGTRRVFLYGDADGQGFLNTTLGGYIFRAAAGNPAFTISGNVFINGNGIWHAGNDGAGSTLDADLLDGQHGSYYRDAGNLNAGTILAARMPALTGDITTVAGAVATTLATVNGNVGSFGSATAATIFTVNAKGLITAASSATITPAWSSVTSKPTTLSGYSITAADVLSTLLTVDGAASLLDADLLDGQHGSWYAPIASPTFTGTVTTPNLTITSGILNGIGSNATLSLNDGVGASLTYSTSRLTVGGPVVFVASSVERFRVNTDGTASFSSGTITANGNAVWHAGNDGAGSTLDADLLDNQHGSYYRDAGNLNAGTILAARMPAHTGDVTSSAASVALTLATVNGNVGSFGSATAAPTFTVNAKGLITAAGSATITPAWGSVTSIPAGVTSLAALTGAGVVTATSTGVLAMRSIGVAGSTEIPDRAAADSRYLTLSGGTLAGYLTLHADPASSMQAATKQYVDTVASGLSPKAACRVSTTVAGGNITLSGTQTIDGVAVVAGNRVLVKNQTSSLQNGIYVCAAGAWSRATDADSWAELVSAFVFIEEGTDLADTGWTCTVNSGGTLGVTAVTWVQFSGSATFTASTGITKSGVDFQLTGQALALHNLATNGSIHRTGSGTYASRTLTAPAAGITVTNGDGVAGNPTLVLANDLAAVEGLATTGIVRRTSTDTWSASALVNADLPASGVSASTYRSVTVNAQGIVTGGTNPTTISGYGITDLLTSILAIDGATSGIDADLLDGQHGSYYLTASTYTAADVLSKLLTVDGAASGLDADLLDGQHGSYYQNASNINAGTLALGRVPSQLVRSGGTGGTNWNDASSTLNGFSGLLLGTDTNGPSGAVYFHPWTIEYDNSGNLTQIAIPYGDSSAINAGLSYRGRYDGTWTSWQKIWTSSNDGASSGLDADLLDGQHGSYYLTASSYTAADVLSKLLTVDGAGSGIDADLLDGLSSAAFALKSGDTIGTTTMAAVNSAQGLLLKSGTATGVWLAYYSDSAAQATRSGYVGYGGVSLPHFQIYNERSGGHIELYTTGGGLLKFNSASVWHASNDGAGSGLDADLLDGVHSSGFLQLAGSAQDVTVRKRFTSSAGTTIGDIYANSYLNSALEVYNGDGNRPAYMSFHITGIAGVTFGLNTNAWLATNAAGMQINGNKVVHAGDFSNSNNLTPVAADTLAKNGISYVTSMSLLGQTDGALYTQAYSTDWQHQIFGDYRTGQIAIRGKNSGTWQAWRTVWDSSNDGAASGLDADLLDGLQGSAYATLAGANVFTNQQWVNSGGTSILAGSGNGYVMLGQRQSATESVPLVGVGYSSISLQLGYGVKSSPSAASFVSSYSGALNRAIIDVAGDIAFYTSGSQTVTVGSAITLTERMKITTAGAVTIAGSTVWHAGNDGSGSGLDADLLDGLNSASAATASTIVARDASAQVFASNQCVSVAAGNGLRLWGGDSGYSIYMSDAANGTWGGRVTSELNSDYNMYFKMSGSTRGYVFLNNTTAVAGIDDTGNIRSKNMVRSSNGFADIGTTMGAGYSARYINPGGGSYTTGTSVITGAIKIRLPNLNSNAMFRMRVEVYNYSAGTSETFVISGYPYNPTWANCSAEQYTDSGTVKKTVRFGNDGTNNCVWIGEVGQVWSYPQVFVTEFSHGYSGHTSGWEGGWGVSFVTAFDTVNITRAAAYHWNSSNDGASSGLDADLLDGQEGSYYRSATNINAGTLSDSYLPTTMAGKTFTSRVTVSGVSEGVRVASDTGYYSWYNTANNTRWAYIQHNGTMTFANEVSNSNTNFVTTGTGVVRVNSNLVWHAGNDGAGSTLDADLLDGYQATSFALLGVASTFTKPQVISSDVPGNDWTNFGLQIREVGLVGVAQSSGSYDPSIAFHWSGRDVNRLHMNASGVLLWGLGTIWNSTNDGAGSGLDADLLDGYSSSTTSDAASTIPVRDGSGYMNQRVIRNASGAVTDGMYIGYGNAASGSTRIYGGGSTTTNLTIQATSMTAPGEVYTPSGSYFRAQGTGGFYCETYNGGWNMTDGTWIRSIADKGIITGGAIQGATVTATSDRRLKTEIQPLTGFGDVIDQTNVYSFIKDGTRQWGVIAQEVLETPAALLVHEGGTIHEEDGDAILTVDFAGFTYALLAEVKELRQRVAAMEARQ